MAKKESAGILPFRIQQEQLQFFLVHPGGPFWKHKDLGSWSIAKGELDGAEDLLDAAKREFMEEVGIAIPADSTFMPLGQIKMKSGKIVHAFATAFDFDENTLVSNLFDFEWPPHSGKMIQIPEVDRGGWFDPNTAAVKIIQAQQPFLERLKSLLKSTGDHISLPR